MRRLDPVADPSRFVAGRCEHGGRAGRLATRYCAPVRAYALSLCDGAPAIGAAVSIIRPDGHVGLHAQASGAHRGLADAVNTARTYLDAVLVR